MAVATIFESEKSRKPGKQSFFRTMLSGGFGAEDDMPKVTAPPRIASEPAETESEAAQEDMGSPASGSTASGPARLGRNAYLRGLEEVIRRTEREEVQDTLVSVSPAEVQRLVRKAAKAKARYLATVLDTAEGETLPDASAVRDMENARERHEALDAGLQNLLAEMRRGNINIKGVDDESIQEPTPDYGPV